MLSIFFGLIALAVGLWGLVQFFEFFVMCLKGIFFPSLAFVGLIAIIAGVSTLMEKKKEVAEIPKDGE